MSFRVPDDKRIRTGAYGSDERYGNNGAFAIRLRGGRRVYVIASDGAGWEHVSVTLQDWKCCPSWPEMCEIKSIFWEPGDCVIQFHPPENEYVNEHPFCLHLWRRVGVNLETPPGELVGTRVPNTRYSSKKKWRDE